MSGYCEQAYEAILDRYELRGVKREFGKGTPRGGSRIGVVRQWKIVRILSVNPRMTVRRLAEKLEVSRKTIYRDVYTLCDAGFPLYFERVGNPRTVDYECFVRIDKNWLGGK